MTNSTRPSFLRLQKFKKFSNGNNAHTSRNILFGKLSVLPNTFIALPFKYLTFRFGKLFFFSYFFLVLFWSTRKKFLPL